MSGDGNGEIIAFFADFENASRHGDWSRYGDLFLPDFLSADPTSIGVVARSTLIAFLPHRKAIFERADATGTRLVDLQVDRLDERHVLAKTRWDVEFSSEHGPVVLRSTFLLRREDRWRIALYLNHANLLELLGLS